MVSERKTNTGTDKLMEVINKIGVTILMNLLFLISSFPVVTIPAAWNGLYGAVRYSIRGDNWFDGYKKGFKTRFLRGMVLWVIALIVGFFFLDNLVRSINTIMDQGPGPMIILLLVIQSLFLLAVMLFTAVMLPVNLYIPTDVNRWVNNSWYVVFHAPLQSLAAAVIMWLPLAVFLFALEWFLLAVMIFVAVYFAVGALAATVLLKNVLIKLLERERRENPYFDELRAEELED